MIRLFAARAAAALAVLVALGALGASPALAQSFGVALVIGNAQYANAPLAKTAAEDSEAVASALTASGYEVIRALNPTRAGMRKAIARFARESRQAERVVVYYSGHAVRANGRTYLAPVDARARSLTDVVFDGVPLDLVMRLVGRHPGRSVVFLDAAQFDGFAPRRFAEPGLAAIRAPEGVIVVSAAEPGRALRRRAGGPSRFARNVVNTFLAPGLGVQEAARRMGGPVWVTGSVARDFALIPARAQPIRPVQPVPPGPPRGNDDAVARGIEDAFWDEARRSDDIRGYRTYLERYPTGRYANAARKRVRALEGGFGTGPEAAAGHEARLGLSRDHRRRVQGALQILGFYRGARDGQFGPQTRRALRQWQRANNLEVTGFLNGRQIELLRRQVAR